MKISRLILLLIIPLLFSCYPKRPELTGTEVPAGPIVDALEQQRLSLSSLKAVASMEIVRRGKKRAFDTVGIVFDARRRLRMEAVGPLGVPLVALVWDGAEITLQLADGRTMNPGQAGIERILGLGVDVRELCAVLSGTVVENFRSGTARAACGQNRVCVVESTNGDLARRVSVLFPADASLQPRIIAQEIYQADQLVYRARYGRNENETGLLPKTIVIENPEKKASLTVEYAEADVNAPVADDAFTLEGEHAP